MKVTAKSQSHAKRLFLKSMLDSRIEIISIILVEMIPNALCPICGCRLSSRNIARHDNGTIRTDLNDLAWCKHCGKKFNVGAAGGPLFKELMA
jgi:hypothetical protein